MYPVSHFILKDGILGVCAGVEMLKVLHDEQIETEFPIGVINWTKYEKLPCHLEHIHPQLVMDVDY